MAVDENEIRTGVDALIKLLYNKKKVLLEEAASALAIPKERLEEWARILEEEGIIKIEYLLTKTYLVWTAGGEIITDPKSFGFSVESRGAGFQHSELQPKLSKLLALVQLKGEQIRRLELNYLELYKSLDPKLLDTQKRLETLKELQEKKEALYLHHTNQLEDIKRNLSNLSTSINETNKRADFLHTQCIQIQHDIERIKGKVEDYQALMARSNSLKSEIERLGANISLELDKQKNLLGKAAHQSQIDEQIKRIKKASYELEAIKKELVLILERISALHAEIQKDKSLRTSLQKSFAEVDKQAMKIKDELNNIEQKASVFGDLAKDVLSAIRLQREELSSLISSESLLRELLFSSTSYEKIKTEIEQHLRDIEEEKKKADAQLTAIQNYYKSQSDSASRKSKIDEALSKITALRETLQKNLESAKKISEEIERLKPTISQAELEEQKKAIQSSIQKQVERLEKLKSHYLKSYNDFSVALSQLEGQINSNREEFEAQIKKADAVISKMKEFEGKKDEVKRLLDSLGSLRAQQEELQTKVHQLIQKAESISYPAQPTIPRQFHTAEFEMSQSEYERYEKRRAKLREMISEFYRGKHT